MSLNRQKTGIIVLILILVTSLNCMSQKPCTWNPEKKELQFSLSELSGILNCDSKSGHGKSHHFSKVIHKPLYQTFLNDVKSKPQSFSINPEIK